MVVWFKFDEQMIDVIYFSEPDRQADSEKNQVFPRGVDSIQFNFYSHLHVFEIQYIFMIRK